MRLLFEQKDLEVYAFSKHGKLRHLSVTAQLYMFKLFQAEGGFSHGAAVWVTVLGILHLSRRAKRIGSAGSNRIFSRRAKWIGLSPLVFLRLK